MRFSVSEVASGLYLITNLQISFGFCIVQNATWLEVWSEHMPVRPGTGSGITESVLPPVGFVPSCFTDCPDHLSSFCVVQSLEPDIPEIPCQLEFE